MTLWDPKTSFLNSIQTPYFTLYKIQCGTDHTVHNTAQYTTVQYNTVQFPLWN